jgi:ABC-type lipoprotein export system ATPase subunit
MATLLEAGPFDARDGEGRELFANAEIRLEEGRATTLEGPSGSGKSTLLRQLAGLSHSPVEAGRRLAGEEYRRATLPAWRARVTLMAQDAPMIPGSVRDNLELPYHLRAGGRRTPDADLARRQLEAVGLGHLPDARDVGTLSGGERHRLALARGLLWDPPVLLADEPLAGLDAETAEVCFDLLLEFGRRSGHALLVVLHHGELADRVDDTVRLVGGRLSDA